ncbi:uncharacterized protein LOC123511123 [Portunus trituberculatus]|uniref:uncharacterized protein LOC123511123 n=1 Tax=Portunus trituberculatus TaxID=210409 RepID=UPI001E1D0D9E|nr:uncharacterized protein LOC123511123 [Portunus trituberculatus]
MAAQQHQGTFKWYNKKSGYGFIRESVANKDYFVHYSGLKRSFRKALPREGDHATFTSLKGNKGPEAREVAREGNQERPLSRPKSSPRAWKAAEAELKMKTCICTAQALAGNNTRRLQTLIPLLLKHNGLPAISIPEEAFTTTRHHPKKTQGKRQPPKEEPRHEDHVEEGTGMEEEEEENEVVDVVGSDTSLRSHTTDPPHHATKSPSLNEGQNKKDIQKTTPDAATTTKGMSLWQWDTNSRDEAPPTKDCSPDYEKIIADMIADFKTDNNKHSQHTQKKRHQRR